MSDLSYDAVVVGGGVIGCTSAFYLARKGLKVAVIERDRLACGTTSKSFAWINGTGNLVKRKAEMLECWNDKIDKCRKCQAVKTIKSRDAEKQDVI